jgi:hypothetical protein
MLEKMRSDTSAGLTLFLMERSLAVAKALDRRAGFVCVARLKVG